MKGYVYVNYVYFNMMCMCIAVLRNQREAKQCKRDRQGELRAMVHQYIHACTSTYNTSMQD